MSKKKNKKEIIRTRIKNCLVCQQFLYNQKTEESELASCSINLLNGEIKFYLWVSKYGLICYNRFEDIPKEYSFIFENLSEDLSKFLCEETVCSRSNRNKAYFCLGCLFILCIKILFFPSL